jgi:hypothetical protein
MLKTGDIFYRYCEAWGVRSEKEWDAAEYETRQIGCATSKEGILWTKDLIYPLRQKSDEGEDLFFVTSPTETDFDFNKAVIIHIEGDDSFWCKFGHVMKNDEG